MTRRNFLTVSLVLTIALSLFASFTQPAQAAPAVKVVAKPALAVVTYGPYAGSSTDSGTCGNNWANDTYGVTYTVNTVTGLITKHYAGTATTMNAVSPGACNTGPNNGDVVTAGIVATFSGGFDLQILTGVYNPAAVCTSACATSAGFIAAIYGGAATYAQLPTFSFSYKTCGNGSWTNSSSGNTGDILVDKTHPAKICAAAAKTGYIEPPMGQLGLRWGNVAGRVGQGLRLWWMDGAGVYEATSQYYVTGKYGDIDFVPAKGDYPWDNRYIKVSGQSLINVKMNHKIPPDQGDDVYKTSGWYQLRSDNGEVVVTFATLVTMGHIPLCVIDLAQSPMLQDGEVKYR